jgi:hypothetical protein
LPDSANVFNELIRRLREKAMPDEIEPPEFGKASNNSVLWRVSVWGSATALALAAVALISQTDIGTQRLAQIFSPDSTSTQVVQADIPASVQATNQGKDTAKATDKDAETQRLAAQVRDLQADRDRLVERVASLEHNLDDITGSIKRQIAIGSALAPALAVSRPPVLSMPAAPPPAISSPATTSAADTPSPTTVAAASPSSTPVGEATATKEQDASKDATAKEPDEKTESSTSDARSSGEPDKSGAQRAGIEEKSLAPTAKHLVPIPPVRVATAAPEHPAESHKAEIGIDLGGARSIDALAARWAAIKAGYGPFMTGMYPVAAHDRRRGAIPLRLVAGPVPNQAAAAQLCARFTAGRINCRPVRFSGDRF